MPRPAPSVSRVVALLNLLSEHEADFVTLAEIARRLDLNKATTHGILTALTDSGYVVRHPENNGYSLGPGLVRVGRMALIHGYEVAALARYEMETLAESAGGQCALTAVYKGQVNVIAVTGVPGGAPGTKVGERGPFQPPFGVAFVAWAPEAEVDRWLNSEPLTDEEKQSYREVLAEVRERGFVVSTHAEERLRLEEAIQLLLHETLRSEVREALTGLMFELARDRTELSDIRADRRYRLRMISAPIFDPDGRVSVALTLTGLPELTGAQVRERAYALSAAADRISKRVETTAVQNPRTDPVAA